MTVQDIIDALSDYGFADTSVPRKLEKINSTVGDIASRQPWAFLETTIDLDFDGTNAKPSNWPADFRAALVVVRTDVSARLEWKRLDQFYREHGSEVTQSGTPMIYYFVNKELRVWPVPEAGTGVLHMPYIRSHPVLAQSDPESAILIPPAHHEAILLGALYKLYDLEDDFDLSQRFQAQFEARIQTMASEVAVAQYDLPDQIFDLDANYDLIEFTYF